MLNQFFVTIRRLRSLDIAPRGSARGVSLRLRTEPISSSEVRLLGRSAQEVAWRGLGLIAEQLDRRVVVLPIADPLRYLLSVIRKFRMQ